MSMNLAGGLWLTSTGRLARRLLHDFRRARIQREHPAWERPDAASLKVWLDREWNESWPETLPAPDLRRMGAWSAVMEDTPPPEPLEKGVSLCRLLDETYGILVRHGIDPLSGPPSTPLVEWRRIASRHFSARLADQGYFHPEELVSHVPEAMRQQAITPPTDCSVLGFEFPSPREKDLFSFLQKVSNVSFIQTQRSVPGHITATALPTPDQEITYLCGRLVEDARHVPLHRIGVIVPNIETCGPTLSSNLEDLLGNTPQTGENWFNITLGSPLSRLPLFTASLLPLRFFLEGEKRETLLSLVLSTYYGLHREERHSAARADRTWLEKGVSSGLDELRRCIESAGREENDLLRDWFERLKELRNSMPSGGRAPSSWIDLLSRTWEIFGFPVLADEQDRLAWRHLSAVMQEFRTDMNDRAMSAAEFVEWFTHRASLERTQPERPEDAGIQIMGIIEARGLEFDKLYLLDMNDHSLPQPVRPLPLMDGSERARVQGGTAESQFEFARVVFNRILHSAPSIELLRAEQDGTKPLTPSPFWPEEPVHHTINIWTDPDPSWLRASWLRAAWERAADSGSNGADTPPCADRALSPPPALLKKLSRGLSPSRLKTALSCPFTFLVKEMLGVKPLEEAEAPPSRRERGERLHRIFASFTDMARKSGIDLIENRDEARQLIEHCVSKEFADVADHPGWRLEARRLLGSADAAFPGIFEQWLDLEAEHRSKGWRCLTEECSFMDLTVQGCPFPVRGIMDRIDFNEQEGWLCLDYKTGRLPSRGDLCSRFTEPQLAVYFMALREWASSQKNTIDNAPCAAGYIHVKSLNAMEYRIVPCVGESLERWREIIADMGRLLADGRFDPRPYPFSNVKKPDALCSECPFRTTCIRGLSRDLPAAENGDEEAGRDD